ncbi:MAG: OmpH family outer membrane protein [Bacteroidales bacterium]|nr:OmpH family outer membrane protein [Bacteroidales bacterium]MDD4602967.1 OmpH family outer membrane protein [Bacteroidales bacterium]
MKRIAKLITLVVLFLSCSFASQAQNPVKIGYIDFNSLLAAMPGIDSVKIKLQTYQKTLSDQMDAMKAEFENKYQDYQSQASGMSDLIKQTKEKELSDLQARIDAFQQKAQQDLQAKQQELVAPFIEKAKTAIKDVAKENKFTYVLNAIEDVVIFKDESDDVMLLVKKKLSIQ